MKNSVKSVGCAAISSMTTDTRRTRRPFFFFLFFPTTSCISVSWLQAALAHLESIIYDPHKLQPELEDEAENADAIEDASEKQQQEEKES